VDNCVTGRRSRDEGAAQEMLRWTSLLLMRLFSFFIYLSRFFLTYLSSFCFSHIVCVFLRAMHTHTRRYRNNFLAVHRVIALCVRGYLYPDPIRRRTSEREIIARVLRIGATRDCPGRNREFACPRARRDPS